MRLTEKSIRDLVCPAGMTERTFWDPSFPASACAAHTARARGSPSTQSMAAPVRPRSGAAPRDRRRRPRCRSESHGLGSPRAAIRPASEPSAASRRPIRSAASCRPSSIASGNA